MAKKSSAAKKSRGSAGIAVIGDDPEHEPHDLAHETNGDAMEAVAPKPKRNAKAKSPEPSPGGQLGISEIKKAAAFVNSVGGLDKALALLQILKVAKEVQ